MMRFDVFTDAFDVFTRRLHEAIARSGITELGLSKASGIPMSELEGILNGRRIPRALKIAKLADALGVSPDYLMGMD